MVEGLEIDKPSGGARPVSHTDPACCAGRVQAENQLPQLLQGVARGATRLAVAPVSTPNIETQRQCQAPGWVRIILSKRSVTN